MNLEAVSVGVISLVACIVLFLLETTTPKDKRVLTRPWVSQSHDSVRISIVLLLIMGVVLIAIGLVV